MAILIQAPPEDDDHMLQNNWFNSDPHIVLGQVWYILYISGLLFGSLQVQMLEYAFQLFNELQYVLAEVALSSLIRLTMLSDGAM
jgi:hypothetical protein